MSDTTTPVGWACCQAAGCPDPDQDPKGWECVCHWWSEPCPCPQCLALAAEVAGLSPKFRAWANARRPTPQTRLRGFETEAGDEAGYCVACEREVPGGPDTCLGLVPLVRFACCGHGGDPDEMAYVSLDDGTTLYGQDALDWFLARDIGPSLQAILEQRKAR